MQTIESMVMVAFPSVSKTIKIIDTKRLHFGAIEVMEASIAIINDQIVCVSVYIPPNIKTSVLIEEFPKLIAYYSNENNVIIGGDINAHDSMWENNSKNDRKGAIISETIVDSNFIILNNGDHTYQKLAKNYTSAIDISLVSPNLFSKITWQMDYSLTTDHIAI